MIMLCIEVDMRNLPLYLVSILCRYGTNTVRQHRPLGVTVGTSQDATHVGGSTTLDPAVIRVRSSVLEYRYD
jgi:hypothetical protein